MSDYDTEFVAWSGKIARLCNPVETAIYIRTNEIDGFNKVCKTRGLTFMHGNTNLFGFPIKVVPNTHRDLMAQRYRVGDPPVYVDQPDPMPLVHQLNTLNDGQWYYRDTDKVLWRSPDLVTWHREA